MTVNAQNIGGNVENLIKQTVRPQPRPVEVRYLPVTISDLTDFLACELVRAVQTLATKDVPLNTNEVKAAFEYLVAARAAHCCGIKNSVHPKDIEYPAFFLPVLQSIGKFVNANKGYEIIPVPSGEKYMKRVEANCASDSPELVAAAEEELEVEADLKPFGSEDIEGGKPGLACVPNVRARVEQPQCYNSVMRVLRSMGVAMSYGLPMDRMADNDDLYRMEVADDYLYGPEAVPAPTKVLARVLLRLNYLSNLYGRADQVYNAVVAFRNVIEEIVFAHVRGPRVLTSD